MSEEITKQLLARRFTGLTLVAGLLLFVATTQAADRKTLSGHVPAVVAHLQAVNALAATNRVNLAIGLSLRDEAGLDNLLAQLSDPKSPNYRHFLTTEQFTEQFGPTEADYQAVIAFAQANGLTVEGTHPNRMVLDVSGAAADVQKAFQVTFQVYQHPTESRKFFAADVEPSVPASLPIRDIAGLSDYGRPHPNFRTKPPVATQAAPPLTGSGPFSNYIGNDFRAAYAPGVTLTGSGQTVALVQFDGYFIGDIHQYESLAGLPNVSLKNVLINGFNGQPTGSGGEVEVSLDIEMVISMAPGVSKVILYEGNPFNFFPNDVLNRIATDNSARQISSSWSWIGGPNGTTDQIFKQMAAQGQTYFNASGDSDAFLPGEVDDPSLIHEPSSSPFITQVGGTTLKTTKPGGPWASETVWNWDVRFGTNFDGVGSCGGISSFYPLPTWQAGVATTNNQGSKLFRNIPDVAMAADDVYVIADGGIEYPSTGGTSCAAPLWAGFMALVNQKAASDARSTVGFINPTIYALSKTAGYAAAFNDITTGSNTWTMSPTNFAATAGYDLCTGLGTPKGISLINLLAGTSPCPAIGTLDAHIQPPNGVNLLAGTTENIFMDLFDGPPVTNATVSATANGVAFTMGNSGAAPDAFANDYIYSGTLSVPANTNQVTLRFVITAPGEVPSTNTIVYNVVPNPVPNDNFANAIKIPAATGGFFLSNDKLATREAAETNLTALATAVSTLWWKWTPQADTNVFVDTTGSAVDRVLAVYTNSTPGAGVSFTTLGLVAVTNNLGVNGQAQFKLNVNSNVTYYIVLGSANTNSLGSLQLLVAPGGQADTTAPTLTVLAPLSGLAVTNALMTVSGVANDPQPGATGIKAVFVTLNGSCDRIANGTTNWSSAVNLAPGFNNIDVYAVDYAGNVSAVTEIQISYVVINPPNDFFGSAIPLVGVSGTVTATTTNATKETGEPNPAGNNGGKSVWWSFAPTSDGVLTLSTTNSTFDTLLGVYTGSSVSALTLVADNDDATSGAAGGYSSLVVGVRSNLIYYIMVDGYDGASGVASLKYSFTGNQLFHVSVTNSPGGTAGPQSQDAAVNSTVTITATPSPGFVFDVWDGDIVSFSNPLTILVNGNTNIVAKFVLAGHTEDFESDNFEKLPWTTAGDAPWFVQGNVQETGTYAARSGVIGDGQSSSLVLTANFTNGNAVFDFNVSSEEDFDVLGFYVDGALQQQWSGESGWQSYSFAVTAGVHTLEWRYTKDASLIGGMDAAFLDNIDLPLAGARQYLRQLNDGTYFVDVFGFPGQPFTLQGSPDFVNWVNLGSGTTTTNFVHFVDPASKTTPYQFYRAVITP